MSSSAFLSSHPTGLPTGMTPVIVDQSPELAARTVFEGHSYHDELDLRSELMPKSATAMTNYGISDIPLRGREAGSDIGTLHYNQASFGVNALSTSTFDSGRSHSQGTYQDGLTSSRPSTSDDGEYPPLLRNYQVKIVDWGPQEGAAGCSVQATIMSPFKINPCRSMTASFGRHQTTTVCTPLGDGLHPYRYVISFQATAQLASQWAGGKVCVPLSLYMPLEGLDQEVTLDLGTFGYTDARPAAVRCDSGIGRKRRTSSTGHDGRSPPSSISQDSDYASAHSAKAPFGQLPPIRAGAGMAMSGSSLHAASSYGSSTLQDEYQSQQGEAVSHFYPPVVPSYSYPASCTPPTPSWTSSASSTVMTLGSSSGTVPLTNDNGTARGHNPRFVRRRNDQIASISAPGAKPQTASFNPYGMYPNHKAVLRLDGDLGEMTRDWTAREKQDKRRLVHFNRDQDGSVIRARFRPIDPEQKEPNLTLISCIWREDRNECYVTSVDTISLLEALVTPDTAFTVEEKNRIRRNLEGFHPETISKQKAQNEEFFKQIMGYPPPRPRHIEKDVKVFKWSTLETALKKIISKYCASYASTADTPRRQGGEGHYGDSGASLQSQDFAGAGRSGLSAASPYALVPSNGHGQPLSMSATPSTFGDYAHSYQAYTPTLTSRYSQYPGQSHYSVPENSGTHTLLQHPQHQHQQHQRHHQQSRPVGFTSDWSSQYV